MQFNHFVGFDPGGVGAFGWAVIQDSSGGLALLASGTNSNAEQAFAQASAACPTPPIAIAVDAPLYWALTGDRESDKFVRSLVCKLGGSAGTVSHVNSLRGACLVQGVLVANLAQQAWPSVQISEAHPKALLAVSNEAKRFIADVKPTHSEHERDAAIAAFTARQFARRSEGWADLSRNEAQVHHPVSPRVSYWFPKTWA